MKIKRFIAPTMRDAMRLVREEQGPDAVILSNRRLEDGFEVVAATDYDAALVQKAAARDPEPIEVALPVAALVTAPRAIKPVAQNVPVRPAPIVSAPTPASGDMAMLKGEIGALRRMMEQQIANSAWGELKTRHPVRADIVRRLMGLGIELKLAREIASEVADDTDSERARYLPMAMLARRLPTFKHEWLEAPQAADAKVEPRHDVIALVGATGVGKTTTIAKLAARYVQHWGLRDVALITTDHFRIGAQEQLFTYGRLLGVPVLTADNQRELCLALEKLKDRRLVLIDTAGMSPRDQNLQKQFAMLSGLPVPNRTALVLSANGQASDLDDQYQRFAPAAPGAVILTKLDEATRVGSAISAVVRHGIPLAYLTDGQRVPEDLSVARADQLVVRAMAASRVGVTPPDDEELTHQFAGAVNA
ncbi:MAG: flhF [Panacagrimonas sp.]|jgi:flagellar biosynthesis protein FlhF|nr:flagellar biosynthesis protein FlhF [Panacagrimonas sp.]MCC2655954.1 flhF [Panacagrimonas sp.]